MAIIYIIHGILLYGPGTGIYDVACGAEKTLHNQLVSLASHFKGYTYLGCY